MLASYVIDAVDACRAAGQLGTTPAAIAVSAPPCAGCAFWTPSVMTDPSGRAASVVLCTFPNEMHADFSCFVPDPTPTTDPAAPSP